MTADGAAIDASQRQLKRWAAITGLLMRNSVNLVVSMVTLADPATLARPAGKWLMAILAVWSLYRILTRSRAARVLAVDYGLVVVVCLAIPVLVGDQHFYSFNTAPQAIAGTAVVSASVAVSPYASLPMTLGVAAAYAWASSQVVGVENLGAVAALYYFALQWLTAALIRMMLLRVAAAVDRARNARYAAELDRQVHDAVRDYEREQLALLHDTAASTLLMVGQGARLPAQRLADQAGRDLDLLDEGPWVAPPPRVELVAALRDCSTHLTTPVTFTGHRQVWLDGDLAKAVIAATREAMNNVDRHADATRLEVTVSSDAVRLADDGVGFDPTRPRRGHGIDDSIVGRMRRAGGHARVTSSPGAGTVTELSWRPATVVAPTVADPDRLIERIRRRYGYAIAAYALANLAFSVPQSAMAIDRSTVNVVLGVLAAVIVLAAIPVVGKGPSRWAWPAMSVLAVVTVVQPTLLPPQFVGGYAHWAQGAVGWCLFPWILGMSTRAGAAALTSFWALGAVVQVLCLPTAATLVNIGLGTGSILGVQLFALMFNGWMRDAARDAHTESQAHQQLVTRDSVARALRDEYHRRYAKLVASVVPLLESLRRGATVDDDLARKARIESRRLRALFDQATMFDHPLMQRLRPLVDAVEARHVEVVVDLAGDLPELTDGEIDVLTYPLARVLSDVVTTARLVVTTAGNEVSVSLVCDTPPDVTPIDGADDHVDIVRSDDTVWCLVRLRLCRSLGRQQSTSTAIGVR